MTHDVYVADRGDNAVKHFSAAGAFLGQFDGSGAPAGPFSAPTWIAVDNSEDPLDVSAGDVYVIDAGHDTVDKFDAAGTFISAINSGAEGSFGELDGIAVDRSGRLWVYQGNGEIDDFGNGLTNKFLLSRPSPFGVAPGFAVGINDELYVNRGVEVFGEINEAGEPLLEELGTERSTGAGVDLLTNHVFVDNVETIEEFDSSGTPQERFGAGHLSGAVGVAVDEGSGAVYVANSSSGVITRFAAIVLPTATTGTGAGEDTEATVNATVDPEEIPLTACEFEYGTSAAYGSSAPCTPPTGEIAAGSGPVPVTAHLTGLEPHTLYHFRVVAANAAGSSDGADSTFATLAPPSVESESSFEVGDSGAHLAASLNPGGLPTTYQFEYGASTAYGSSLPVAAGDAGAGIADETVSAEPLELEPSTTYHYRLSAKNELGGRHGGDRTFTTQPTSTGFALPDGRAWEMVSPTDKHGGVVQPLPLEGAITASTTGDSFTFLSDQSLFDEAQGAPTFPQVLATRTASGWISKDIATPHETALGQGVGQGQEYRLFSEDLSHAVLEPFGPFTPLSTDTEASERTPWIRDNTTGVYTPLLTAQNVPPGTIFGGDPNVSQGPVSVVGATPDLSHVILHVAGSVALTEPPTSGGLYEWTDGHLQLVSVFPDETPTEGFLGYQDKSMKNAVSADGSRVFWETQQLVEGLFENHLYLRNTITDHTIKIDTSQPGASGAGNPAPKFQFASKDGSKVFFTDEQQLTPESDAETGSADLYECEVNAAANQCGLKDLTSAVNSGERAGVSGYLLGASRDGETLYLVASGVLASGSSESGEQATPGEPNLYVLHRDPSGWTPTYVATLSSEDEREWTALERMSARVSGNGRYLAFVSGHDLTGYDNTDASSGQPDKEVLVFDRDAAPHLKCVSCNPTGARPVGAQEIGTALDLVDHLNRTWPGSWLSATVPTWEQLENASDPVYQPRYLSDTGRLFFNSYDALVPQDKNHQWDVYESEPLGTGTCTTASETSNAKTQACTYLISSGRSHEESAFLDASESGGDVFFITAEGLAPQDSDGQLDVYDAHECSLSPCTTPVESGGHSTCTAAETCRRSSPIEAGLGELPASATLSGSGNAAPVGPVATGRPRGTTRRQRLAAALKACRRKSRAERPRCRKRAIRRYRSHTRTRSAHRSTRGGR